MGFINLKVAFFTEAGTTKGMGHLVRSYTIFQFFKKMGWEGYFFLDSDIDFKYKYPDVISFTWEKCYIEKQYDVIFIDSYIATIDIYNTISRSCKVAVYIDDYKRLNYPKGIIINFAPDADTIFYKNKEAKHHYLLGLRYIPIKEILTQYQQDRKKQIFIMLGGNDINNLNIEILDALKDIDIKKVIITNKENDINKLEQFSNTKVLFKPNDKELIDSMAKSSLAISTSSMSVYELAFLKIPTLIIAINYNQKVGVSQLLKHKLAFDFVDINAKNWKKALKDKINTKNNFDTSSEIDSLGCKRIFNYIVKVVA